MQNMLDHLRKHVDGLCSKLDQAFCLSKHSHAQIRLLRAEINLLKNRVTELEKHHP